MRIRKFNELYKSTYLSAGKSLSQLPGHKNKAKELLKHGSKRGINNPVEKIFTHGFKIESEDVPDLQYTANELFFIQDYECIPEFDDQYSVVNLIMKSNFGTEITVGVFLPIIWPGEEEEYPYKIGILFGEYYHFFDLTSRRDAVQLKKFLLEDIDDLLSEDELEVVEEMPIKSIYHSDPHKASKKYWEEDYDYDDDDDIGEY